MAHRIFIGTEENDRLIGKALGYDIITFKSDSQKNVIPSAIINDFRRMKELFDGRTFPGIYKVHEVTEREKRDESARYLQEHPEFRVMLERLANQEKDCRYECHDMVLNPDNNFRLLQVVSDEQLGDIVRKYFQQDRPKIHFTIRDGLAYFIEEQNYGKSVNAVIQAVKHEKRSIFHSRAMFGDTGYFRLQDGEWI